MRSFQIYQVDYFSGANSDRLLILDGRSLDYMVIHQTFKQKLIVSSYSIVLYNILKLEKYCFCSYTKNKMS